MSKQPIVPGQLRLTTLQVHNWGTFSGLHTVHVAREGFLVFGPSGSGKSTLIDAVSTILGPSGRPRFNAAATESGKKSGRDLVTYCRGAWQKEHDAELDDVTRSYLRPGAIWSGVGLHFSDANGTEFTAIRIMCLSAKASTPADIKNRFLLLPGFVDLKECEPLGHDQAQEATAKKLFPECIAMNRNHAPFTAAVRRQLGIADDKALELLQRTQSAKTLGDLNQLIREFMLPEPPTFGIADSAAENFVELKTAYATVVKAREQIEALRPLRANAAKRDELLATIGALNVEFAAIPTYTAKRRLQFEQSALQESQSIFDEATSALAQVKYRIEELGAREQGLNLAINGQQGAGIAQAKLRVKELKAELGRVQKNSAQFHAFLSDLTTVRPANNEDFINLRGQLQDEIAVLTDHKATNAKRYDEILSRLLELRKTLKQTKKELDTAQKYASSMDARLLAARRLICDITGIDEKALPFVADLIHIDPAEVRWQPAAERVMGGFARTLLVPDEYYGEVVRAVDATHLGTKLTYIHFDAVLEGYSPSRFTAQTLGSKIIVEPGRFEGWIQYRLSSGFDHLCAENAEEFRRADRAVTMAGQIHDKQRHVKDDRSRIDDRSRWVLYENSEERIELLIERQKRTRTKLEAEESARNQLQEKEAREAEQMASAKRVLETESFAEIDEAGAQENLDTAQGDLDRLVDSNKELARLESELRSVHAEKKKAEKEKETLTEKIGVARKDVKVASDQIRLLSIALEGLEPLSPEVESRVKARLLKFSHSVRRDNIDQITRDAENQINKERKQAVDRCASTETNIRGAMDRYLVRWPERQGDLVAEMVAVGDFLTELDRLEGDDLPAFESNFRKKLFGDTNHHLQRLRKEITSAAKAIRTEIDKLNQSLAVVDFYPGRTLRIEVRESMTALARDFSDKLARAVDGTLENDESRAQERFEALSAVIDDIVVSDRTTANQRKMRLDTRFHVAFYGVEVDAAGNRGAVYDSAEGLSGGQAQKLSSFCLAAALRFRLTGMGESASKARKSRVEVDGKVYPRYGTIILDEAFDRADADFTRTSMEVFDQFGFHMILATPEKLLQPVEDYIGGVLMVECKDRRTSTTSSLTIEEAEPLA